MFKSIFLYILVVHMPFPRFERLSVAKKQMRLFFGSEEVSKNKFICVKQVKREKNSQNSTSGINLRFKRLISFATSVANGNILIQIAAISIKTCTILKKRNRGEIILLVINNC